MSVFYELTDALKEDGAYNLAIALEHLIMGKIKGVVILNKNLKQPVKISLSGKHPYQRAQELLRLIRFSKEVYLAISKESLVISEYQ